MSRTSRGAHITDGTSTTTSSFSRGAVVMPTSMSRARGWSADVENLYRFQQAGYRDETEYRTIRQVSLIDRWPETGFVKKLQRRDDTFYYYDRQRECLDRELYKVKVYAY